MRYLYPFLITPVISQAPSFKLSPREFNNKCLTMGVNARSAAINENTGSYEGTREVTLEDCAKNRLDENNKYQQFTYTNHGQLKLVYVERQTKPVCITVKRTTTDQNGPCNVDPMYPQFGSYLFAGDCEETTTTMSDGSSVVKALDTQTFFWNDNEGTIHIGCDHLFAIGVPTNVPNAGRQVVGVASKSGLNSCEGI